MGSRWLGLPSWWWAFLGVLLVDYILGLASGAWKWLGENANPLQGLVALLFLLTLVWQKVTGGPLRAARAVAPAIMRLFQSLEFRSPVTRKTERAGGRPVPPIALPKSEPPIFLPDTVTPAFLIGVMEGHTDVAARRAIAPYLGKWMRVSGTVRDVSETPGAKGGGHTVAIAVDTDKPATPMGLGIAGYLDFDASWDGRVGVMPRGTRVTVKGCLTRINPDLGGTIDLDHCELVEGEG